MFGSLFVAVGFDEWKDSVCWPLSVNVSAQSPLYQFGLFDFNEFDIESLTLSVYSFKCIPGCFFTRTSLLKSSNNLKPICNDVNIKCSWLVIFWIISVTNTFTLWETYTTSVNLINLKLIIFSIPLHSTIYNALFFLSLSTAFVV